MKIPLHLDGPVATGIQEGEPVAQFEIGPLKNFVYLILDWKNRKASLIDPQKDLSLPLQGLEKFGFELSGIFLTHSHPDHTAGLPELIQQNSKTPIFTHPSELFRLEKASLNKGNIQTVGDGDLVPMGDFQMRVFHTPGHSAGGCCYLLEGPFPPPLYLFTGDTVFIRDCGRTDLETGSVHQMFQSLQRIKTFPHNSVILPGHHYRSECASILAQEISHSLPFQCKNVEELEALP